MIIIKYGLWCMCRRYSRILTASTRLFVLRGVFAQFIHTSVAHAVKMWLLSVFEREGGGIRESLRHIPFACTFIFVNILNAIVPITM